jgi:hypothetical protein
MTSLPPLEHTSNATGRLIIYHIQQGDTNFNDFYLYKTVVLQGGIIKQDKNFLIGPAKFEFLDNQVILQGFVALPPSVEDDPRIFMTYL